MRNLCMAVACCAIVFCGQASARAIEDADIVISLPRYADAHGLQDWQLSDSEWGYITDFNRGLSRSLRDCPDATRISAIVGAFPTRYSNVNAEALDAAVQCGLIEQPRTRGDVSLATWLRVTGHAAPPLVFDRVKTIIFRRSELTPDYANTVWDLARIRNRDSVFTWGPMNATLGVGCTARRALTRLSQSEDPEVRAMLRAAFAPEAQTLQAILAEDGCRRAMAIMEPVQQDAERRQNFSDAFVLLSDDARVRTIYDLTILTARRTQIQRYYDLYFAVGVTPSEIDFAFILEHALLSTPAEAGWRRLDRLRELATARAFASNAEVRKFIAREYLAQRGWVREAGPRSFMRGRAAAFYAGASPQESLTPEEMADWVTHSRVRAENVGLSDEREFLPCEHAAGRTACTPLFAN